MTVSKTFTRIDALSELRQHVNEVDLESFDQYAVKIHAQSSSPTREYRRHFGLSRIIKFMGLRKSWATEQAFVQDVIEFVTKNLLSIPEATLSQGIVYLVYLQSLDRKEVLESFSRFRIKLLLDNVNRLLSQRQDMSDDEFSDVQQRLRTIIEQIRRDDVGQVVRYVFPNWQLYVVVRSLIQNPEYPGFRFRFNRAMSGLHRHDGIIFRDVVTTEAVLIKIVQRISKRIRNIRQLERQLCDIFGKSRRDMQITEVLLKHFVHLHQNPKAQFRFQILME